MIRIVIFKDIDGIIRGFEVKGHANFAKKGKDIVCSAISAIAYTGVGALSEILGINGCTINDGYIKCLLHEHILDKEKLVAQTIFQTVIIGFRQIEYSYKKYVTVSYEEV